MSSRGAKPDFLLTEVLVELPKLVSAKRVHDGVVATTHCMYPSNGLVQVTIRGGEDTIVASDEGGAFGEALSAGIPVKDYDRTLGALVKEHGLLLKDGVIHTPRMPLKATPLAILLVANASQEVARWMYDHVKIKRTRDFKAMLKNPKIIQRIVYDDEDDWSPADLNLLQVGAITVPFSRAGEVIERLV